MNRGLDRLRDVLEEARSFLSLPRPEPPPDRSARRHRRRRAPLNPRAVCLRCRSRFRARSQKRICANAALRLCTRAGSLRFHPRCYYRPDADAPTETWPALIAAVTDLAGSNHRRASHLARPVGRAAKPLSTRRGGRWAICSATRSGSVSASDVMAAGEGIETMLSLRSVCRTCPWPQALSANHLAAILFPPTLRRLYVARDARSGGRSGDGDPDRTGADGRYRGARAVADAGRLQRRSPAPRHRLSSGGLARAARPGRRGPIHEIDGGAGTGMKATLALRGLGSHRTAVIRSLFGKGPRPRPSRGRSDGKLPGSATAVCGYFPPRPGGPALHRETK